MTPSELPTLHDHLNHAVILCWRQWPSIPSAPRLGRSHPNRFQFLPPREKLRESFFRTIQIGLQLICLRRMRAMEIWGGKQTLDADDVGFPGVNLRFHPFQFPRLLERKFADAVWLFTFADGRR